MATKWGICGAGVISHDFVIAMQLLPPNEHQVVAVATRDDLTKAKKFADEFGIPKTCNYIELAQSKDVDVVYVATIHVTHYEVCRLMIEAGKNVLCEKPLCINARQCEELINLAKKHNVFFMEGMWSRFFPAYQHLRLELDSGSIGEATNAFIPLGIKMLSPRIHQKELGGGAWLDLGCYVTQLALWIFKSYPVRVTSCGRLNENGVDLFTSVTFEFEGGKVATAHVTALTLLDNTLRITGTNGRIEMPMLIKPTTVITGDKSRDFPLPATTRPTHFQRSAGFTYEAQAVRECLLRGEKESHIMSHADSLQVMKLMDEVRRQIGVTYDFD